MTPALFTAELARARQADLRRAAAHRLRLAGVAGGCAGFFTSLVARLKSDVQRVQLGPSDAVPCPC